MSWPFLPSWTCQCCADLYPPRHSNISTSNHPHPTTDGGFSLQRTLSSIEVVHVCHGILAGDVACFAVVSGLPGGARSERIDHLCLADLGFQLQSLVSRLQRLGCWMDIVYIWTWNVTWLASPQRRTFNRGLSHLFTYQVSSASALKTGARNLKSARLRRPACRRMTFQNEERFHDLEGCHALSFQRTLVRTQSPFTSTALTT